MKTYGSTFSCHFYMDMRSKNARCLLSVRFADSVLLSPLVRFKVIMTGSSGNQYGGIHFAPLRHENFPFVLRQSPNKISQSDWHQLQEFHYMSQRILSSSSQYFTPRKHGQMVKQKSSSIYYVTHELLSSNPIVIAMPPAIKAYFDLGHLEHNTLC